MDKGTRVRATRDIGGIAREEVPEGSEGKVTKEGGWFSSTEVAFHVHSWWSGDRVVVIEVDSDEIEPA